MDAWQTSVEARLGEIRTELGELRGEITQVRGDITQVRGEIAQVRIDMRSDFRWLLGVFGGGFALLLGTMLSGFLWIADKLP